MTVIPLGGRPPRQRARGSTPRQRRSPLLYEEVIELVGRLIADGDLVPGDKLPSQRELAELAQVSLITVRRALEELEHEGRVRRHQGMGTFLAGPKILSNPGLTGRLGDTLGESEDSHRVGSKLLGITRCLPSADVAAELEIDGHDQVWQVHRVRMIGGKPSIAERALIPVQLAPDLDDVYRGGSLYDTLRTHYGLDDDYEEQVLDVIHADSDVRSLLHLNSRALVVRIRGLSRDKTGVPFDCFEQVYSAGDFAFVIAGQTERRLQQGGMARDWSATPLPPASADPSAREGS
jgi:DNA-binding GntR family transcriptional regulator